MDFLTLLGLVGVGVYVGSYGLVQANRLDGNGSGYSVANVLAASLVLVSLIRDFNLPSAVIQITWIIFGIAGLLVRYLRAASTADLGATASLR